MEPLSPKARADRLARIRSHTVFNDLFVSPSFAEHNIIGSNALRPLQPPEKSLRRRRFGRFKVLAHMTSMFAVDHSEEKWKILADLFAAGLTGIDRIVLVGTANLFRLYLYIFVFVVLCVVMMYFIGLSIIEYLNYNTIVTVSLLTGEVRVLPAITICNMNPFKNDKLCDPKDVSYSEREDMCKAVNLEHFALAMSRYKYKAAGNATLEKFIAGAMYTWDEVSHSCRFNRELCSPEWVKDVFVSIYHFGRCFCIFCNLTKVDRSIDFATIPNPKNGLDLVLRSEPSNHIVASKNHGFLIMIHDRSRMPDVNSEGVYVPVGLTTYLGVSMKQVNLLSKPFASNCHTSWPQGEPYNAFLTKDDRYSEQGCRKVCLNYNIMKDCSCLDLYKGVDYQRLLDSNAICVDDDVTLSCREARIRDPENMTELCNCPKRCDEVQFMTTMSQISWNAKLDEAYPTATSTSNVVLYADSFAVNQIIESQETSATSALSTVGGFMNMFTGASFLLVYEALSTLMIWVYKVFTMKSSHADEQHKGY